MVQHLSRNDYTLKSSHVIVELDLEVRVRAVLDAARAQCSKSERGTSKITDRMEAEITATGIDDPSVRKEADFDPVPEDEEFDWSSYVKRTFIDVPIPSSMLSTLSVHAAIA